MLSRQYSTLIPVWLFLMFALPQIAFAVEAVQSSDLESIQFSNVEILSTGLMLKIITASLITLAIGFVVIWGVKKKGYLVGAHLAKNEKDISVLKFRQINKQTSVAIIKVDGKKYLIANTHNAISIVNHDADDE